MTADVKPIPEGHHTVVPHLVIRGGAEAIEFYKRAFGAQEHSRSPLPDGRLMHAEMQIGDSRIFLADEFPEYGSLSPQALNGSPVTIHLWSEDVDSLFQRAQAAGAEVAMPLEVAFWGDRYGVLTDPYGHRWSMSTHVKDVTPEEMQEAQAAFSGGGEQH